MLLDAGRVTAAVLAAGVLNLALVAGGDLRADEPPAKRGAALIEPFKRDLKEALLAGMQKGPENAVNVCKVQAPAIAANLSVNDVEMGRSSHRLRNPANTMPDWAAPVMRRYLADTSEREPAVVALPGGRAGYVEPIVMQPLCLACHGTALKPAVTAQIATDYPDDEATGFEAGELRGVFWVEFPVGQ